MPPGYMQLGNGPAAGVIRTGSGGPARSSIDPAQMPRPDAAAAEEPEAQVLTHNIFCLGWSHSPLRWKSHLHRCPLDTKLCQFTGLFLFSSGL